jgi:hypothetical protein
VRPVIPRVRVGDILSGTRNLRHYLQTAVTLNYLEDIHQGAMGRRKDKQHVYNPAKDEKFLVVANAWGSFCAVSTVANVGLFFRNPTDGPIRIPMGKKQLLPRSTALYMAPAIFSQWFIRTEEKQPDVRKWPDYAFHIWASAQMNLCNIVADGALTLHLQGGPQGPFSLVLNGKGVKRDNIHHYIREWSVRGHTRLSYPDRGRLPNGGYGPRLEDLSGMKERIRELCRNPRVVQRLKSEDQKAYQAILSTNS